MWNINFNNNGNKRIEYIDIMKDFAIMLVVMGHVLLGCKSESMPE